MKPEYICWFLYSKGTTAKHLRLFNIRRTAWNLLKVTLPEDIMAIVQDKPDEHGNVIVKVYSNPNALSEGQFNGWKS